VVFDHASFRWDTAESDSLKDLDMEFRAGELVGVCGAVGAGKSTLLSAILGQVTRVSGNMTAYGRVSFVAQQPWILNMTMRDNILFGANVDEAKYQRVLDACCLLPDLAILPAGDRTEIGERGINLSGGQKARVSLARAVYNDADVYLLDDPLSAVDQHVGKRLFNECILGLLRGKTVVLVTHQLQYLSQCHQVVFMDGGRVTGAGSFHKLQASNAAFRELINTHVGDQDKPEDSKPQQQAAKVPPADAGAAASGAAKQNGASAAGGLVMKGSRAARWA
jgi:ABC-type multidrug transport system fused ATPase/permease subunit